MNRVLLLAIFSCAALVACGREETPVEPQEPAAAPEEQEVAPEPAAVAEPPNEDRPELVEESAAEADDSEDEEQPILLARAPEAPGATTRAWKFTEGKHYHRLVPTQPTVGGADKIEVAEIFWYGCPHCYSFEPHINGWAEKAPSNARFVRIPAVWNPLARLHGQLYYTEEVLARNGKLADPNAFHAAVFNEFHNKRNRLASEEAIQKMFERFGVSADDFSSTWNSFEVNQKVRVADDLVRRYNVTGVPAIVVNGKYRAGGSDAGGNERLLELIDELIERESIR